jgi:hypothetical protein
MDASTPRWFTSSFSGGSGNGCVEIAFLHDGTVGLRDTKDRTRTAHRFSLSAWTAFLTAARAGRFAAR